MQQTQFEDSQKACRQQCALDIRGNSSSFKRSRFSILLSFLNLLLYLVTSTDTDPSSIPSGECFISVPSLNMCFSTNKLQPLNIAGNIFDVSRTARPLTIQDYISILIDHDKHLDSELVNMINNLSSLSSRYKHLNNRSSNQMDTSGWRKTSFFHNNALLRILDVAINEKSQADYSEASARKKSDSDSIVRGLLSNSIQYSHDKQAGATRFFSLFGFF